MNKLLEVPPEELTEEDNNCKDITSDTWKSSAKVNMNEDYKNLSQVCG